jgi:hypothetical protein
MIEYSNHKIKGIIADIKTTQEMIYLHQDNSDPLDAFMVSQFSSRKRKLFRELLSELALSDLRFQDIRYFIDSLTNYIEQGEEAIDVSPEMKSNLTEIEALLVA